MKVLVHWSERLAQAFQIYVLGWPPPAARGHVTSRPKATRLCSCDRIIWAAAGLIGCPLLTAAVFPQPPRVGPALLTVRLTDTKGTLIAGARVRAVADMTHPGMTPVLTEARLRQDGVYESRLDFGMAGSWFVTVSATLPDGSTVTDVVKLLVVRAQ